MLFIEYPKCSTCKKAKAWLEENGFAFTDRHIVQQNPTAEELALWQRQSDLPLKRFFNVSGLLYKSLALKDKLPQMTEAEQLALLSSDGMLVKRPILVDGERVLVGFKASEWEAALKK